MTGNNITKLGIFDSGLGGLSILKKLTSLPIAEFVYLADTAHMPYGDRIQQEILTLTHAAVKKLMQHDVDAIVIACHTASALALENLQEQFPTIPIFGVIDAVTKQLQEKHTHRVGIIGTQATIQSQFHQKKILELLPHAQVITKACPKLVPLIESGLINSPAIESALEEYLTPLADARIDTLIFGCTHYELIKPQIALYLDTNTNFICSSEQIAYFLQDKLAKKKEQEAQKITYLITGNQQQFSDQALSLTGLHIYR